MRRRFLPQRTVRLRLTLFYSALFLVSGTVLLTITYLIVRHSIGSLVVLEGDGAAGTGLYTGFDATRIPPERAAVADQLRAQAARLHAAELHQLLVGSAIALAMTAALSIAFGWLTAGRFLRPLQSMTL